MSKTVVIIPVFNGADVLPRFISTFAHTVNANAVTLVAVDNNSQDNSVEIIRAGYPSVVVIQNAENRGFAPACNQGIRWAMEHDAKYVMFANQDLSFENDWLEPLVDALDKDPHRGAVQPLILLYPETTLINSCGNALHYLGFGFTNCYRKQVVDGEFTQPMAVAYCSGAALLMSIAALRKVGVLDDAYFMYHEESDLCWRMRIAGYHPALIPVSRVYHEYEFSGSTPLKFALIERNRLLNLLKNYQIKTLVLIFPMLLFWECGMIAYSVMNWILGKKTLGIAEKLQGYAYLLHPATQMSIARWRKKIAALRTVPDREIVSLFTDRIDFQDVASPLLERVANPITQWYWSLIKRWI